jgi:hypothetical protein
VGSQLAYLNQLSNLSASSDWPWDVTHTQSGAQLSVSPLTLKMTDSGGTQSDANPVNSQQQTALGPPVSNDDSDPPAHGLQARRETRSQPPQSPACDDRRVDVVIETDLILEPPEQSEQDRASLARVLVDDYNQYNVKLYGKKRAAVFPKLCVNGATSHNIWVLYPVPGSSKWESRS